MARTKVQGQPVPGEWQNDNPAYYVAHVWQAILLHNGLKDLQPVLCWASTTGNVQDPARNFREQFRYSSQGVSSFPKPQHKKNLIFPGKYPCPTLWSRIYLRS